MQDTQAPETIWAQDTDPNEGNYVGGGWWDDCPPMNLYPGILEYTLKSTSDARIAELEAALVEMTNICGACLFETIRINGQYVDRKEAVERARAALGETGAPNED